MIHRPANPDFEAVVRASFARQTFMAALGATLEEVGPGRIAIAVPFRAEHAQQNGFLHAGVITSVADSACGYSALTLAPAGYDVLAVEFKINLLRPAVAPRFVARADVLRAGRTLTVARADVFGTGEAGADLVASMMSTLIARPIR
ncbi:MAG TPA: PaaI family thioesterase [Vicinamibacteria bacterium]|nr:PaaI family thioesterase [Vicinamibacteria bacterium]